MVTTFFRAFCILAIGGLAMVAMAENCVWTPQIKVYLITSSAPVTISISNDKVILPSSDLVCGGTHWNGAYKFFVNYECCNTKNVCVLSVLQVNEGSPELTDEAYCKLYSMNYPRPGRKSFHSASYHCCK